MAYYKLVIYIKITAMEKLTTYIKNDKIIVQRADYIEDGWYVLIEGSVIKLMYIPHGGGEDEFIKEHDSLLEAIEAGGKLT